MVFNCKICGGSLEITKIQRIVTCPYCGVQQTLPNTENEKIANLYDRANHFLRNNDYDKAEAIYETILDMDTTDGEAYWSLVMCKYGVEHVKDPKSGEYIPTCNRTQTQSIFSDDDYKKAIENSTEEQQAIYKKQAEEINEIQKKILEISKKEPPYDVFICYKEKNEKGERTLDSVLAQDVYTKLTSEGLKVFFARITLEDKIGTEYEPYIYSALNSAKVMIVIGTNKDNLYAPWVRNEWSRYLNLIKQDQEKILIPCFKDMDAYDLPEEFAHIQAQDMSKIGFMQDLIRGIKKITNTDENVIVKKKKVRKKIFTKSFIKKSLIIIVVLAIIGFGITKFYIEPKTTYNLAVTQYNNKEYFNAIKTFEKLGNYSDCDKKINEAKIKWRKANGNIIDTQREEGINENVIAVKQIGTVTKLGGSDVEQIAWPLKLKKDGTVEVLTEAYKHISDSIKDWNNIVSIRSSVGIVYGLTADGKVKSAIYEAEEKVDESINAWTNIIQIEPCLLGGVVGLKDDGTVISKGIDKSCILPIKEWKDIVQLSGSNTYLVGLKSDGTVNIVYTAAYENMNLQDEKNVIQLSKNDYLSNNVSLIKEDGTVKTYGDNTTDKCNTQNWENIVYVYTNSMGTYGVTKNGTIEKVGGEKYDNAVYFTGIKMIEEWRTIKGTLNNSENNNKEAEASKENEEIANESEEIEEGVIGNGTSTVKFKEYTYNHRNIESEEGSKNVIVRTSNNPEDIKEIYTYKKQDGWFHDSLWINDNKIYVQVDGTLKCMDLNGENEKDIVNGTASSNIKIDFNKKMILYQKDNNIEITNLDGEGIKSIPVGEAIYLKDVTSSDEENVFFTSSESGTEKNEMLISLYVLNKNSLEFNKITTEKLNEGWYGCDIYQVESNKDFIYYIAGSKEGTGGYFNGNLYKIKKDGTGKEEINVDGYDTYPKEGYSENVVPTITIKNNYLYYNGLCINLETNEKANDNFENGDVIDDDDYVYTTSLSTPEQIILAKYKARTDMENLTKIFTKDIPSGSYVDIQKNQLKVDKNYVYITISYTDLDNETGYKAWQGVVYNTETYRMKKDGSGLKQM